MRRWVVWTVVALLAVALGVGALRSAGRGPAASPAVRWRPAAGRAVLALWPVDVAPSSPVHRPGRPAPARARYVDALAHSLDTGGHCRPLPPRVAERQITRRQWLSGVVITEYYPAPERWFTGRRVQAPGLSGRHAVDWLYSSRGLAMEGDGVDSDGRAAHVAALGSTGWVNYDGRPTEPVCLGKWSGGPPVWLKGGWRNRRGQVTFPLASGGWANGAPALSLDYGGVTFSAGASLPLHYYHSIAVDPGLIPLGSRVFVPAYRRLGGGWFVAQDTGGAIRGRHIDVYRPPPASPDDLGRYMTGQRVLVIPPGA